MRWTTLTTVLASFAVTFAAPGTPAMAAAPTVSLLPSNGFQVVGGGYLIWAACRAVANPGNATDQIATATSVSCTVANASGKAANPGNNAVAVVTTSQLPGPYTVCISGSASFIDVNTNEILRATAGPTCVTQGG